MPYNRDEQYDPAFPHENVNFEEHIMTIDDFLPEEWIDNLEECWSDCEARGYVKQRREYHNPDRMQIDDRSLLHMEIPKMMTTGLTPICHYVEDNGLGAYNTKYNLSAIDTYKDIYVSGAKLQKTLPGEGYHIWHHEHGRDNANQNTMLAWMIYLNDINEGGETEFLHQSIRIQPRKNMFVCWPAYFTHMHRGNPPLKEEKFVVTGWIDYF